MGAKFPFRLKHGWCAAPPQRKQYGYYRCTSGVFGGVAWTKWLMINLRKSHVVSVFFGVTPLYKSLAKWGAKIIGYGRRRGEGALASPSLGDSSSPGVACMDAGDRGIPYREMLRGLNHARS